MDLNGGMMAKDFSKHFYSSPAWRKVRKSFIAHRVSIDGGMCEECHDIPGYIVDHKDELTPDNINNPMITMHYSNFRYLCLACHNKKTFGKKEDSRYYFGSDGQVYQTPPINDE